MKTRLIDNKETLIERLEREKNNDEVEFVADRLLDYPVRFNSNPQRKIIFPSSIIGIPIPKTFVDRHLGFFFILGVFIFSLLYMFLALIQIGVI